MPFFQLFLIIIAVSAVAVADIFLKKIEGAPSLAKAFTSPWMAGAIALYLLQIFLFTFLFLKGAKLYNIGMLQTVCYALIVLLASVFLFGETISPIQYIGIAFALIGVILLNL